MTELAQGDHVLLRDGAPTALVMEATWSPGPTRTDLAVFVCTSAGTVASDKDLITYMNSNTVSSDRSVFLLQDYTGGVSGAAQVMVDITGLRATAEQIDVVLVAPQHGETLQPVRDIHLRVWDPADGKTLASSTLPDGLLCSVLVLARLSKHQGQWRFCALGEPYPLDFASQAREYGLYVT